MNRIRIFQVLVIAATACYVVWFFLPYWATDVEQQLIGRSGSQAILPVNHPLYYGTWFVLWIAATAGVVLFQNWTIRTIRGQQRTIRGLTIRGQSNNRSGAITTVPTFASLSTFGR